MENTIFYGNGLNLLNKACLSWKDLLKQIAGKQIEDSTHYSLMYERLILLKQYSTNFNLITENGDHICTESGDSIIGTEITEDIIKADIANKLKEYGSNKYYNKLIDFPVKNFITTNYDNTLEETFKENGYSSKHSRDETKYSLLRHTRVSSKSDVKTIWQMHGEINNPQTIMLGLDHYCGAIHNMYDYINSHNKYNESHSIKEKMKIKLNPDIKSWIDLFFFSNVHIIGFSFDFSEIDLWWLLTLRAKYLHEYFAEDHVANNYKGNKIFYYGKIEEKPEEKNSFFKAFDIEFIPINNDGKAGDETWSEYYDCLFEELSKRIK